MIETVEQVKEAVADKLRDSDIVDRLRDSDLVERLRESDVVPIPRKPKRRKSRALLFIAIGGGLAILVYVMKQRAARDRDVAPDPYGQAVEAERRAGAFA